jgi:hypothetical protein
MFAYELRSKDMEDASQKLCKLGADKITHLNYLLTNHPRYGEVIYMRTPHSYYFAADDGWTQIEWEYSDLILGSPIVKKVYRGCKLVEWSRVSNTEAVMELYNLLSEM